MRKMKYKIIARNDWYLDCNKTTAQKWRNDFKNWLAPLIMFWVKRKRYGEQFDVDRLQHYDQSKERRNYFKNWPAPLTFLMKRKWIN